MEFPIVIYKEAAGGYIATVPDFIGCCILGESVDDVLKNAPKIIAACIDEKYDRAAEVYLKATPLDEVKQHAGYADAVHFAMVEVEIPLLVLARPINDHVAMDIDMHVEYYRRNGHDHKAFLIDSVNYIKPEVMATKGPRDMMNACMCETVLALAFDASSLELKDIFRVFPVDVREKKMAMFKLTPEYHRYIRNVFFDDNDISLTVGKEEVSFKIYILQLALARYIANIISESIVCKVNARLEEDPDAEEFVDFDGLIEAAFFMFQNGIEIEPGGAEKAIAVYDFHTAQPPETGMLN